MVKKKGKNWLNFCIKKEKKAQIDKISSIVNHCYEILHNKNYNKQIILYFRKLLQSDKKINIVGKWGWVGEQSNCF